MQAARPAGTHQAAQPQGLSPEPFSELRDDRKLRKKEKKNLLRRDLHGGQCLDSRASKYTMPASQQRPGADHLLHDVAAGLHAAERPVSPEFGWQPRTWPRKLA